MQLGLRQGGRPRAARSRRRAPDRPRPARGGVHARRGRGRADTSAREPSGPPRSSRRARVRIVATLRADFYDAPLVGPRLRRPPGRAQRRRSRRCRPKSSSGRSSAPADRVGLTVEPRLLAAMVADVVDRPGRAPAPPVRAHRARRTRGRTASSRSRRTGRIGGVSGALARRAEQLFDAMNDEASAKPARQLFLRLVTLGEGTEDTRRRVPRSELAPTRRPASHGRRDRGVRPPPAPVVRPRLRRPREPTVEIAHEALLGAWARLRGWIDEARDDIRTQRQLWPRQPPSGRPRGSDESFLLRGARLEQIATWAEHDGRRPLIDRRTSTCEPASPSAMTDVPPKRPGGATSRARAALRLARSRALVAVFAVAALVAASLTSSRDRESDRAERESRVATARELAAASVASLETTRNAASCSRSSRRDHASTYDGTVLPEAEEALHRAVQADRILLSARAEGVVRYSPDGSRLFMPGLEPGTAQFFDATTGKVLMTLRGQGDDVISQVSYSPDGRFVSTSSRSDASTDVWDAHTGELLHRFIVPQGNRCAAGPSSRRMAPCSQR